MEKDLSTPVHRGHHWPLTIKYAQGKLDSSLLSYLVWGPEIFAMAWNPAFPGAPWHHLSLGLCLLPRALLESEVKISTTHETQKHLSLPSLGQALFSPFLNVQQRGSKRKTFVLRVPLVSVTKMLATYFYFDLTDWVAIFRLLWGEYLSISWIVYMFIYFLANSSVLRNSINALHGLPLTPLTVPSPLSSVPGAPGHIFSKCLVLEN